MTMWTYRTAVERVVDGDTLDLRIDLGFGVTLTGDEARVRLRNVDTAEIYGARKGSAEYEAGQRHTRFVEDWVAAGGDEAWPFLVRTWKDDERGKYGRWLAVLQRRADDAVLNDDLIAEFGDRVRA